MTRIRLLDEREAPLLARRHYAHGFPGSFVASLAQVPEVLEVAMPFIGDVLGGTTIDPRTAELAILRASAMQRCEYCTLTHSAVALGAGLRPYEVRALCDPDGLGAFTDEREAALLAWVDAVAIGAGEVPDDLAGRFQELFEEPQVVEITLLIGCTVMLNRYCTALRLPASSDTLAKLEEAGLR
jgi:AhpD family alkylhydroperoxidase